MEEYLAELAIGTVVFAGGLYLAWRFRHQLREKVGAWLRDRGLEKSALMDVVMVCDRVAGAIDQKIVCKIFATTQQTGEQKISEETLTLDEIKRIDSDLFALLEKQGHVRKSILKQVT